MRHNPVTVDSDEEDIVQGAKTLRVTPAPRELSSNSPSTTTRISNASGRTSPVTPPNQAIQPVEPVGVAVTSTQRRKRLLELDYEVEEARSSEKRPRIIVRVPTRSESSFSARFEGVEEQDTPVKRKNVVVSATAVHVSRTRTSAIQSISNIVVRGSSKELAIILDDE